MSLYESEIYSFSISDQSCKKILHYFAKADDISHKRCEMVCQLLGIGNEQLSLFASREKVLQGLELLVELIEHSPGHQYRLTKLQHFIDSAVIPAESEEEFYIHITSTSPW